jgi:hypothetical protein
VTAAKKKNKKKTNACKIFFPVSIHFEAGLGFLMHGYLKAKPRSFQPASGDAEHRTDAHATGFASASGNESAASGPLHGSPNAQSLLQMRQALDKGAGVQSQLALQRALNRRRAGPEPAPTASHAVWQGQGRVKPALQMKGVAINADASAPTVQLKRNQLNPKQARNRERWMTRHAERNVRETQRMNAEANLRNIVAPGNINLAPTAVTGAAQTSASVSPHNNINYINSAVKQGDTNPKVLADVHKNINYTDNNNTASAGISSQSAAAGFSLHDVKTEQDTAGWRGDHDELKGAHHKYPKSALVRLHEWMTKKQQAELGEKLHLDPEAGAMAMTRLRSNLISPKYKGLTVVTSDKRLDDAHNNREEAKKGEEGLDLVSQTDGDLTPRSNQYLKLKETTAVIHARYSKFASATTATDSNADSKEAFELSDSEMAAVTGHLLAAEQYHYAIEKDPKQPSHAAADDVWEAVSTGPKKAGNQGIKYRKKAVPPIKVDPKAAAVDYDTKKDEEAKKKLASKQRGPVYYGGHSNFW